MNFERERNTEKGIATFQNEAKLFAFPQHPEHRLHLHFLNQPNYDTLSGFFYCLDLKRSFILIAAIFRPDIWKQFFLLQHLQV